MAAWTQAYINDLQDSAFLWIAPGGEKDSEGKTTPRSLRHLPYKDANGTVDLPHVRNALARLDQVEGMPADIKEKVRAKCQRLLEAAKTKADRLTENGVVRIAPVTLDANGELPTRIQLFITGDWPNSIKGNFAISLDDLREIKQHFDDGIGFPTEDGSTGLAIDFEHDYAGPAAAWIKGLDLVDNGDGTGALYADPVEWTAAGADAIRGGVYKCISPMGAFGKHDDQPSIWQSVTDLTHALANVLEGAGLTNIPFLQGMSPIRASATADDDDEESAELETAGMLFVRDQANKSKETTHMTLDELRVKDQDKLSAEEKAYLAEHKDELSADERTKFGLEAEKTEPADQLSAEDKDLLAAIKSGDKVVVAKDQLSALEAKVGSLEKTAQEFERNKAEQFVGEQLARGAIVSDQKEANVTLLLSLQGDARTAFEDHLKALPSNELLAKEVGHSETVEIQDAKLEDELKQKTEEFLSAAKANGRTLTYGQAMSEMLAANEDLRKRADAARNTNK